MPATEKSSLVRLLPGTREKLDAIAGQRRWKMGTTIDAIADKFIEVEGITVPQQSRPSARKLAKSA